MKKLIVFNMITVDGFFAGPNGEIDWHNVDAEFNDFAIEQLDTFDTLMFGRVTYDLMASYWPTPQGVKDDPVVAEKMNSLRKIVFSKSLQKVGWQNSELKKEIVAEEIERMKQESGKDIAIFGSGAIVSALTRLRLIDEYRFIVNPVILGKGKLMITDLKERLNLTLVSSKTFKSGNVLVIYRTR